MVSLKKRIVTRALYFCITSIIILGCIENRPIKDVVYINEREIQKLIGGEEIELIVETDTACVNELVLCAKLKHDYRLNGIDRIAFNVNLKWEDGMEYIYVANIHISEAELQNRALISKTRIATNIDKQGNGVAHIKLSLYDRSEMYKNLLSLGIKSEKIR